MRTSDTITEKLTEAFAPQSLRVEDESHRHEGHAGHRPGGQTHYRVYIVSEAFRGKSRIDRHRMINAALARELEGGVHALATAADYEPDLAAGHRTLAVRFGRRAAAIVAFATFFVTWLAADFNGTAVRAYIAGCTFASLSVVFFPREKVISLACVAIFAGFLLAGVGHVYGW